MDTHELTDAQWKDRTRTETGHDPMDILRPRDVAELIGVQLDTIYQMRRFGNIPVPDLQTGGRKPGPGELITWKGRKATRTVDGNTVVNYPVATSRRPKPGELLHPKEVGWFRWRIHRWMRTERKGSGWHDRGDDRVRYKDRSSPGPGEWVPPVTRR